MAGSVYNFYLTASVDGRATRLEAGPRAKTGGFSATVRIRSNGSVLDAVELHGTAHDDGTLTLHVVPHRDARRAGDLVASVTVAPSDAGEGGFMVTARR
jgi:hypothetical protein